jgi:hypothetical protein
MKALVQLMPAQPSNLHQGTAGTVTAAVIVQNMAQDRRLDAVVEPGVKWLESQARSLIERYWAEREGRNGLQTGSEDLFDAISGLAGMGRVLLLSHQSGYTDSENLLRSVLSVLTDILAKCRSIKIGMAHGAAGPLSLLSIAMLYGIQVDGQRDAIRKTAAAFITDQQNPVADTWKPRLADDLPPSARVFHGWCVGTAGIAQALRLAGQALEDETSALTWSATQVLGGLAKIPSDQWGVSGSTLCCGYAGVLQTVITANSSRIPRLDSVADSAVEAIIENWDPDTHFGFPRYINGTCMDSAEFLYGASGVGLALHDYVHGSDAVWPSILLLR